MPHPTLWAVHTHLNGRSGCHIRHYGLFTLISMDGQGATSDIMGCSHSSQWRVRVPHPTLWAVHTHLNGRSGCHIRHYGLFTLISMEGQGATSDIMGCSHSSQWRVRVPHPTLWAVHTDLNGGSGCHIRHYGLFTLISMDGQGATSDIMGCSHSSQWTVRVPHPTLWAVHTHLNGRSGCHIRHYGLFTLISMEGQDTTFIPMN